MKLVFFEFLLAGIIAVVAGPPAQAGTGESEYRRAQLLDARVATVGHRLAVGSLDLCSDRQWHEGFVVADIAALRPDIREVAIRVFGVDAGLGVTALAAGGPAERAGILVNDVILAVDGGQPRWTEPAARQRPTSIEDSLATINAAFADGRAQVQVARGQARLTIAVAADQSCSTHFRAWISDSRRARADGSNVRISAAMVDYAADDGELAAVLAHELAHNILRHSLRLTGVSRGILGIGRDNSRIRETEIEADRLSVYLMDRAGYDPEASVRFWRRFGPSPLNFLRVRDHPGWRTRIRLLQAEIAVIRRARADGTLPIPAFVQLPLPPAAAR